MAVRHRLLLLLCAVSACVGEAVPDPESDVRERNLSSFLNTTHHRLDAVEPNASRFHRRHVDDMTKRLADLESRMTAQNIAESKVLILETRLDQLERTVIAMLSANLNATEDLLTEMIEAIATSTTKRLLALEMKRKATAQTEHLCDCVQTFLRPLSSNISDSYVGLTMGELKVGIADVQTALEKAIELQHSEREEGYTRLVNAVSSLEENLLENISSVMAGTQQNVLRKVDEAGDSIIRTTSDLMHLMHQAVTEKLKRMTEIARDIATIPKTIPEMMADLKETTQEKFTTMTETLGNITKDACTFTRDDRTCEDFLKRGKTTSGVYSLHLEDGLGPLEVYCDMSTDGGGWVVFQRRKDGSVDFYRDWKEYEMGFGDLTSEFWLGTFNIHRLTQYGLRRLRVDLQAWNLEKAYASYSNFDLGDISSLYRLNVSGYSGTAGDGMAYSNMAKFSTPDRDSDTLAGTHCARDYHRGAWWHMGCTHANLNGPYGTEHSSGDKVIFWDSFRSNHALMITEMKVREKEFVTDGKKGA